MGLLMLDAVLRVIGVRGQIPGDHGLPHGPGGSPFAASTATLMRILAAAVVSVVLLSLALWAAVWFAIRLL